jgi:hypothetical protein
MMGGHRDRVEVWPLSYWQRPDRDPALYWTNNAIMQWRIPTRFEHVAYVEQGADRGPLLRSSVGRYVMLLPGGSVRSVNERKVTAALAALQEG